MTQMTRYDKGLLGITGDDWGDYGCLMMTSDD